MSSITITAMAPHDALLVSRQPSQAVQLGLDAEMSAEISAELAENGEAWTAWRDGVAIAVMGIRDTFPGAQGVAWAILSSGLGGAHLAISRHCRRRVAESPLIRVEAIVRIASPAECAWAKLCGLEPEAVLRRFGAKSEDHMLYSRIR